MSGNPKITISEPDWNLADTEKKLIQDVVTFALSWNLNRAKELKSLPGAAITYVSRVIKLNLLAQKISGVSTNVEDQEKWVRQNFGFTLDIKTWLEKQVK